MQRNGEFIGGNGIFMALAAQGGFPVGDGKFLPIKPGYDLDESAQILGLDKRTVRRFVEDGSLPARDVGAGKQRFYRISPVALVAFMMPEPWTPEES